MSTFHGTYLIEMNTEIHKIHPLSLTNKNEA